LVNQNVREEDLPGIGRRYTVNCDDGGVLTIVVHNSGRRDVYLFSGNERDDPVSVSMHEEEAEAAGSVLSGDYSPPIAVKEVEEVVGTLAIEWISLDPGSPGTGRSIQDLHIRSLTGVNVMAIVRDHNVIHSPGDSEVLEAGDRLVVAGRRERMPDFHRLVLG
jgi:TrkA domain protein